MKSFIKIGIIFVIVISVVSCGQTTSPAGTDNNAQQEERIFPVRVQKIEKQKIERTLEYTANLIAFKEIHYAPASPGRIHKIHVDIGNRITKGQLLVEMDRTQLNQALTQLENARSNFRRLDTLYQLGSISEQQYEQVKTQYELAKSNVEFLSENTTLNSPIDGLVTGKYYENGEFYSGAPNTMAGKAAVVSLMQIQPLKAIVNISQNYYPKMEENTEVKITTDIYPGNQYTGRISKIYPTIDQNTRTFKTEIIINNNKEELRPGMFARINIHLQETDILVVPASSVLKQEGTNNRYIFVNEEGSASRFEVETGKRFDDKIEIIADDIHEGMDLVVDGQASLLKGSKLRVVNN